MKDQTIPPEAANKEVAALLRTLHETEQRLQELTRGQMDAAGPLSGHSHLLGEAHQKLLQSEERFRHLEENIADVLWIRSPDLKELYYVSPAFERIWGRPVETLRANPHLWSDFIVPEDRARVLAAFAGLMGSAPELDIEYRISRPDGGIRWVNVRGFKVRDQTGNVIRLTGIVTDITERRRAREQLKLLETCVAHLTDLVIILEAEPIEEPGPRIVFVNDAFVTRTGYAREETLGRSPRFLEGPKTQRDALNRIHVAMQRFEPVQVEIINYTKSGEEFWLDLKIVPVAGADGRITHFVAVERDITDRKRADEALHASEEKFRVFMAHSPAAGWIVDANGCYRYASPGYYRMFGWGQQDVVGWTITELCGPALAEIYLAGNRRVLSEQRVVETINPGRRMDDSPGEFLVVKFPIHVADGEALIGGLALDITERKQAENLLRISEERYRLIFNANPQPMFVHDLENYRFLAVNQAAIQTYGFSEAEFLAMTVREIRPPGEIPRLEAFLKSLSPGKRTFGVWLHQKKNGNIFYAEISSDDMDFGGCPARIVLVNDITERRRAEDELSRSHAQVREQAALLDAASDAIILKDMNDRILFWSRGAEQIYGWTAAEAIGRVSHKLLFTDPVRFAEAQRALLQKKHWRGEIEKYTKDRRPIMVEARWTVVPDKDGQPKSILDISTDITERKRLEAQFLRVQRMESIGTLASGVAHDLNNMLTPITMSIQLLQQKVKDQEGRLLLDTLQASAQRGADLVKQVLSFARGVEGRSIPINPVRVLRDIQKIIGDTFPKNIDFTFLPARDVWTVIGDPTQLHQVFLNLSVNARDAMPLGGRLTIAAENTTLDENCVRLNPEAQPGTYVLIQVTDTGTGIPAAIRDRIFEPFFTTKEIGKGTGLGLSTTQAIIKSHEGFINVLSEPGKGSAFKVYLPAKATEEDTERAIAEKKRLPSGHGELVLVVDDEESIRLAASRTLERFGYRVLLAANGAEAVVLYARQGHEIAIVLTDMAMPVMDGPSTVVALKVMNPKVRLIGSSGHASNESMTKAATAGLKYFIPKPYTAEALLNILAEALHE